MSLVARDRQKAPTASNHPCTDAEPLLHNIARRRTLDRRTLSIVWTTLTTADRRDYAILALYSLLLLLLLAGTIGYSQLASYRQERKVAESIIHRNLALMQLRTDSYLERQVLDAELVARSPSLNRYLHSPSQQTLAVAQDALLTLSDLRPYLDQVRYLDPDGIEQIRVDRRNGQPQLSSQLQNKSGREYVREGRTLVAGQYYLSTLDPNREHGQVEYPYRPMLRVVTPVGTASRNGGMVVLNARAEDLIQRLQAVLPSAEAQLVMLNAEGGWITGGGHLDWRFAQHADAGLNTQAPGLWAALQASSSGRFEYRGQCHYYRWYQFDLRQGPSPRWLLAQRTLGQGCAHAAKAAVRAGSVRLLLATLFSMPLLWLWQLARLRARALQRGLRESNAQLELVTREVDLGLLMVDHDCRVCWINPEAERLLGWPAADLIGRNLHEQVHLRADGQSLHAGSCPTLEALANGQRYRNDNDRLLSREGNVLQVSMRVSPYGEGRERKAIVALADVSEHVRREQRLARLASTDELTGVLNRRSILQQLQSRLELPGKPLCVVMADIDFFKQVNDRHGHASGDRVLTGFAHALGSELRKDDLLGRVGGEEFLLVLDNATLTEALAVVERMRQRVAAARSHSDDGAPIRITASFGIACHDGQESLQQLLARADAALYRAKHGGRNRAEPG